MFGILSLRGFLPLDARWTYPRRGWWDLVCMRQLSHPLACPLYLYPYPACLACLLSVILHLKVSHEAEPSL